MARQNVIQTHIHMLMCIYSYNLYQGIRYYKIMVILKFLMGFMIFGVLHYVKLCAHTLQTPLREITFGELTEQKYTSYEYRIISSMDT